MDVVTEAEVLDFGDGTGSNIAPGVGVEREGDRLELSAGALVSRPGTRLGTVRVKPPADTELSIGKIYTPVLASGARGRQIADGTIRSGSEIYTYSGDSRVFARAEDDPAHILFGVECLQIAGFHAASPDIQRSRGVTRSRSPYDETAVDFAGMVGKGGPLRDFPNLYEIPKGAALTWPDGAPAGTSVRKLLIQRKPIRRGARRCFTLALSELSFDRTMIEFCVGAKVATFVG